MGRALPAVAAAALIGGSTALAFFAGGFFDRPRLVATAAAWVLVALAALFAPRPLPATAPGRVALGALVLLCAWTALSITWAPIGGRAEDDLQRLLLYVGAFFAALAFLRDRAVRPWVEPGVALGALLIALYGLSERLLPGLIELDRSITGSGRLEQPLTYWNALGLVAAVGVILAIRLAGDARRPAALRAAAAAGGVPLGLAVYLSFARGALAALAVGLLVLVALVPAVRGQLRAIVAVVGAAALASAVANALPTVKALDPGVRGEPGEGAVMLLALLVLAGAAAAIVLRRPRRALPAPRLPASRPVTVLSLTVLVLLGGALAVALLEGKPENTSPARGADPARFGSIDTNRYRYWEVAVREFAEHPLAGLGSGGFAVEWLKEREREDRAVDAHSLYFETAAELGVVGIGLLLTFIAAVAAAATRLYRRDPAAMAGPAAALAAWAAHAGLDWDWEMPAVTLPALLLAAGLVAWSEDARRAPVPDPGDRRARSGEGAAASPAMPVSAP
jgi:hypothetical protein